MNEISSIIPDGAITGIAFDWITTNLYGVSEDGYIFACKPIGTGPLSCVTVLQRRRRLYGIALNPNEGYAIHKFRFYKLSKALIVSRVSCDAARCIGRNTLKKCEAV